MLLSDVEDVPSEDEVPDVELAPDGSVDGSGGTTEITDFATLNHRNLIQH